MYALNAEELVVLGNTLAAGGSTSLNLAVAESDDEVSDEGVLGLTAAVGDHNAPAVRLRELGTAWASRDREHVAAEEGYRWTYAWIDSETVPIWLTCTAERTSVSKPRSCPVR